MKTIFFSILLIASVQIIAQSAPATKDDIRRLDEKFDLVIEQMDKRFEQVDKRFEQVDKRFEDMNGRFETMSNIMLFGFGILISAVGVLFLRSESNTRLLLREIAEHKTETKVKFLEQKQKVESNLREFSPLDSKQLIYILANTDEKDKQKIKELLHI